MVGRVNSHGITCQTTVKQLKKIACDHQFANNRTDFLFNLRLQDKTLLPLGPAQRRGAMAAEGEGATAAAAAAIA
jgi:hypothetical protein